MMELVLGGTSRVNKRYNLNEYPCPTIMAGGLGGVSHGQFWIEGKSEMIDKIQEDKPPYKIPSMQEIAEIQWNGYNVISTFSGCGGSGLGYKLAGYKVLWANEFIPIAADTYEANHKGTIVDRRDIKKVLPEEILEVIGLKQGELDLMDGSPPCQAFSTAGKREKGWGKDKQYDNGISQKNETLFDEYIRILKVIQPKVFIAENVSGLLKGTAKGYFKLILQALKDCGYNVKARLLDAQWLGVPQQRQRVIFQGVRNDIDIDPCYPKPLDYRYTVRDALPWIVTIGSSDGFGSAKQILSDNPYHTVATAPQQGNGLARFVEAETDISKYAIGKEWDNLKEGESSDKYFNLRRSSFDVPSATLTSMGGSGKGVDCITHPTEKRKFSIAELKRICAFPDDFQLLGTFSQQWERLGNCVPPMMMYYISKAVQEGVLDKILSGVFVQEMVQR
jgi:DNA (cytosine-5)-methyltransferase 1